MNGHVVSEILTDDGWHVVDPDYGVSYQVSIETLEGEDGPRLMRLALKNIGYKEEIINKYIKFFQSSDDNVITEIDTAFSPRLYVINSASEFFKWVIPILAIFFGMRGIKHTKQSYQLGQGKVKH